MFSREAWSERIDSAGKSLAYKNYLEVRDCVFGMLEDHAGDLPSDYWKEEIAGFEYMFDAPPLIIGKLREHCYHLTGLRSYDYRSHHRYGKGPFKARLRALKEQDRRDLFVPENSALGGFGYRIDGHLLNLDTLKYYESIIALDKASIWIDLLNSDNGRKVVIEIGGGWGGFAYQLKRLIPNLCYVIVDLPETLLFSATYLKSVFPGADCRIYGDRPDSDLLAIDSPCDFVFLPHYCFQRLRVPRADLAVNMASFQEMSDAQIEAYVSRLAELGCTKLYSFNRDTNRNNPQLSSVKSVLSKYYDLARIEVLDTTYAEIGSSAGVRLGRRGRVLQAVKSALRSFGIRTTGSSLGDSPFRYQHLVCHLRGLRDG